MVIKSLEHISFDSIITCFFKAFENYFVPLPNNKDLFKARWENAGVNFKYSYGMFDGDQLIAFIIHAIDYRKGHKTAFNTGTGVLPGYRGQRIVQKLYDAAIPELKKHDITRCTLEVITQNNNAIKAYKRIGFKITKEYHCYNGSIAHIEPNSNTQIKQVTSSEIDWESLPRQEVYSWDHQKETLKKSDFTLFKVFYDDQWESYFIMDTSRGYIAQFDVLVHSNNVWDRLFQSIRKLAHNIKVNNVDSKIEAKIATLKRVHLPHIIDQYEMELFI
ncbi:GNAT family N-acetyltransferase [bacterium SCSIO 12643]|nr:GNAT family N-acetyltransferase [bacterium SCSIO 12643]